MVEKDRRKVYARGKNFVFFGPPSEKSLWELEGHSVSAPGYKRPIDFQQPLGKSVSHQSRASFRGVSWPPQVRCPPPPEPRIHLSGTIPLAAQTARASRRQAKKSNIYVQAVVGKQAFSHGAPGAPRVPAPRIPTTSLPTFPARARETYSSPDGLASPVPSRHEFLVASLRCHRVRPVLL